MRNFDLDLVAYRGEEGQLIVMDAYCPHMGANLGVGGTIEGSCLRCPFHSWLWDQDGRNVDIPYASGPARGARIRVWTVWETAGHVFLWYSWRDAACGPKPDVAFLDDPQYYWDREASARFWPRLRLVPQMITENIVDGPHIEFVHLATSGAHIMEAEGDGPVFRVKLSQTFMTGTGPVLGIDTITAYGVGTTVSCMEFKDLEIVNLLMVTPVEGGTSDLRVTIAVRLPAGTERPPSPADIPRRIQKAIDAHLDSQDQDIPIWEAMRYVAKPLLVGEEAKGHRVLRKWAARLYEDRVDEPALG
jgi:nitrite reductase/ring-hydroxylating ferredoxin subunit